MWTEMLTFRCIVWFGFREQWIIIKGYSIEQLPSCVYRPIGNILVYAPPLRVIFDSLACSDLHPFLHPLYPALTPWNTNFPWRIYQFHLDLTDISLSCFLYSGFLDPQFFIVIWALVNTYIYTSTMPTIEHALWLVHIFHEFFNIMEKELFNLRKWACIGAYDRETGDDDKNYCI